MARRSILTPALEERPAGPEPAATPVPPERPAAATRPSRSAKLHIGGYFDPNDPTVIAFQKLRIDLRTSQQEMLLEAVRDFVAKHETAGAFQKARG
jgi:hypothetical protein